MPCTNCTKEFSLFTREYGCTNCGFSVCSSCLKHSITIQDHKGSKQVEVCLSCLSKHQAPPQPVAPPEVLQKRLARQPLHGGGLAQGEQGTLGTEDQKIVDRLSGRHKERQEMEARVPILAPNQEISARLSVEPVSAAGQLEKQKEINQPDFIQSGHDVENMNEVVKHLMEEDTSQEGRNGKEVEDEGGREADCKNNEQISLMDILNDPMGMSFDSSESNFNNRSCSGDSSDFQLAENCDLSQKLMLAISSEITKEDMEECDQYKFSDDEKCELENSHCVQNNKKKICCNKLCTSQTVSVQFHNKMKEIMEKTKAERKQFLLDHLIKQEELDVETDGFQFYGYFFCKVSFALLSGVSNYLVGEACKAFEAGQTVFSHGNVVGMRETEATLGFIIWMKHHAVSYGNQAPDEETLIIPACYHLKDLFQQYEVEVPLPQIRRSTFYRLFHVKFGPYREDKSNPHIRLSNYSSHSKCDTCLLLDKHQKSCKKQEDLELVKSMKQSHKLTYQKSYQAIQEKRFQALSDPDNYLHLQGLESIASAVVLSTFIFLSFNINLNITF